MSKYNESGSTLYLERIELGEYIACDNAVFSGTHDECIDYYYANFKGKRAKVETVRDDNGEEIMMTYNFTDYEHTETYLPLDINEWRDVWCKSPEDPRGTKNIYEIKFKAELACNADDSNIDEDDEYLDCVYFEKDANCKQYFEQAFIRANTKLEAIEIAEKIYPSSEIGYTVTRKINNRNHAINDYKEINERI